LESKGLVGLVAGVCTSATSIPQIIKTIKKKKAVKVSPVMFLILLAGNTRWVWYGVLVSELTVTLTNCLSIPLDLTMLSLSR
jgi:MtN3 and saliva related transmembrane protein